MPALDVNTPEVDPKTKSPYDAENNSPRPIFHELVQITPAPAAPRWVPSQFNCRTTDHDGSLIVWNTKSGAMSVFNRGRKAQ